MGDGTGAIEPCQRRRIVDTDHGKGAAVDISFGAARAYVAAVAQCDGYRTRRFNPGPGRIFTAVGEPDLTNQGLGCCGRRIGSGKGNDEISWTSTAHGPDDIAVVGYVTARNRDEVARHHTQNITVGITG